MDTHAYIQSQTQQELFKIFQSLWFDNLKQKMIIEDSYFNNLYLLMAYADEKKLDPIEYVHSIRNILLQMPGVHAKTANQGR